MKYEILNFKYEIWNIKIKYWVLLSAARLIARYLQTCPNVHESSCMLDELHWFLLKQRISFRIIGLVWRSFQGLSSGSLRHYH